ncbi:hypothetical protein HPB51_025360 [Rhipicephalus microplus]|uniref:Uncharacterized protein n=1 Tax=Rhipicephalus microplus TaxID=6941 RepID=A0A9J6E5J5_RHIMP|nr:hypothetical protein HPB51_025360 [Rhipicephalus microplus]
MMGTSPTEINRCIYEALVVEDRDYGVICPNKIQNILVVSTPELDRTDQYRRTKQINARGKVNELAVYETAPVDTSQVVIGGISLEETPGTTISPLVTPRNPIVITSNRCKRIVQRGDICPNQTDRLCPGCGAFNPHKVPTCEPKCQMCGKDYSTAEKKSKAKYKKPFIVKQKQWAKIQENQRQVIPPAKKKPH